eukprot:scaffold154431_cov14-Tisochrysis_lutea.AAC.1
MNPYFPGLGGGQAGSSGEWAEAGEGMGAALHARPPHVHQQHNGGADSPGASAAVPPSLDAAKLLQSARKQVWCRGCRQRLPKQQYLWDAKRMDATPLLRALIAECKKSS